MNILADMDLFIRVVHQNGLAAAGRELGLTPSSVTTRIKNLEKHYEVKLLTRTTRNISLTEEGHTFYTDCLETLEQVRQTENKLKSGREQISGPLRITATSDMGRRHIAPLLHKFVEMHPNVKPFLNLSDAVTHLTENDIDVAIRYGVAPDSQLIAHKLVESKRVLCASPEYLKRYGTPEKVSDLKEHLCLTMMQIRKPLSKWYFDSPNGEISVTIQPARSCDDGEQIKQWAIDGGGIVLKSIWDVVDELNAGLLVPVLEQFDPDYNSKKSFMSSDLYIAYQDREYVPKRQAEFTKFVKQYFEEFKLRSDLLQSYLVPKTK